MIVGSFVHTCLAQKTHHAKGIVLAPWMLKNGVEMHRYQLLSPSAFLSITSNTSYTILTSSVIKKIGTVVLLTKFDIQDMSITLCLFIFVGVETIINAVSFCRPYSLITKHFLVIVNESATRLSWFMPLIFLKLDFESEFWFGKNQIHITDKQVQRKFACICPVGYCNSTVSECG